MGPSSSVESQSELTIGEVAERARVATSAIRFYEREGLLPRAARRNGRRVFDAGALERLRLIELAKSAGFSLGEVRQLLAGFKRRTPPGERWRSLADQKLAELDARIAEARRMKRVLLALAACECPTLEACGRAMRG